MNLSSLEESADITANTTLINNEVTRATLAETANADDITDLQTDKEDTANKSTDITLSDPTNVEFPTELAVKTYVDTQVDAVNTLADGAIYLGDGTNEPLCRGPQARGARQHQNKPRPSTQIPPLCRRLTGLLRQHPH